MNYIVDTDSIVGLKGKKYFKGEDVKSEFFTPGHAEKLEKIGFLVKKSVLSKLGNKDKS